MNIWKCLATTVMIQKINTLIKLQKNAKIGSDNIFVIDYTEINGGEVEILDTNPGHDCVHLSNENNIEVYYVAFQNNALKVNKPEGQVEQCECVLFPTSLSNENWVLFIETKYSSSFKSAMYDKFDYPNKMINQIISTVNYFRENNILPADKQVQAIISFPSLIEPFSEAIFTRSKLTQTEISINYKITLKPANAGVIISKKRIKI